MGKGGPAAAPTGRMLQAKQGTSPSSSPVRVGFPGTGLRALLPGAGSSVETFGPHNSPRRTAGQR